MAYVQTPVDRMLKYFKYDHLPPHLQSVSKPFGELAKKLCENLRSTPERTIALRKLLEAKDCAVRAFIDDRDSDCLESSEKTGAFIND